MKKFLLVVIICSMLFGGTLSFATATYERVITVTGPATAQSLYSFTLETRDLIDAGKLRSDRKDFKLYYGGSEIDYVLRDTTTILFRIQSDITSGNTGTYYLYYGDSGASTDPKNNKRNVFPKYSNGSYLSDFNITGSYSVKSIPRPEYLKFGANPTLKRSTNPADPDYSNVRDLYTMYYENGWYYCFYDGLDNDNTYWNTCLAKSQDLKNWTKLGRVITNGAPGSWDAGSASGSCVFKFDNTYYMYYLGCPGNYQGIPTVPYETGLATASSIEGPWTKQGRVFPVVPGSFYSSVALLQYVWYDNTISKYRGFFCAFDGSLRAVGLCQADSPLGPWTNITKIITDQVENTVIIRDPDTGRWYLHLNAIGKQSTSEYTDSEVMYWSDNVSSWNVANQTTVISPSPTGAWDSPTIGLLSSLVNRNNMVYGGYDGGTTTWHVPRDGGSIEAKFPYSYINGIDADSSAVIQTVDTFSTGDFKIAALVKDVATVGLMGSGSNRALFKYFTGDENLYVDHLGSLINTSYIRGKGRVKTYEIKRTGSQTIYIYDGATVYTANSVPTGNLPLYSSGGVVLEETYVLPTTVSAASVSSEQLAPIPSSVSGGSIAGGSIK